MGLGAAERHEADRRGDQAIRHRIGQDDSTAVAFPNSEQFIGREVAHAVSLANGVIDCDTDCHGAAP